MLKCKHIYNRCLLLTLALAGIILGFSSCSDEGEYDDVRTARRYGFAVLGNKIGGESLAKAATRGTAESGELQGSVGMSCYTGAWNENSSTPDFFYNEEIIYQGLDANNIGIWLTTYSYFKPATGTKRRFFAYYPYYSDEFDELHNMSISEETVVGYPSIDYEVPENVADHKDLMVGCTEEDEFKDHMDTVSITLHHLLTGVKFAVGTTMQTGKITKIVIKNVFYKGRYEYPAADWLTKNEDNVRTFTLELNKNVNAADAKGTAITAADQTFLMMPQTVPNTSVIEVTFNDGQDHVLTSAIGGKIWERGKLITYYVSITSLMRMTITSNIVDWDSTNSFTGEVSDAANVRNEGHINDWTPDASYNNNN